MQNLICSICLYHAVRGFVVGRISQKRKQIYEAFGGNLDKEPRKKIN